MRLPTAVTLYGPRLAFSGLAMWMGWAIMSGYFLRAYAALLYAVCTLCVPADHPATAETLRLVCLLCAADLWGHVARNLAPDE